MELGVLDPEENFGFFTLGEGRMLPSDRLSKEIHSSVGPFRMVRLTKHVMIDMYRMIT